MFILQGRTVQSTVLMYTKREKFGNSFAKEHPAEADIVVAVPDSSIPVALVTRRAGNSICRRTLQSKYVGRTFIEPDQSSRKEH